MLLLSRRFSSGREGKGRGGEGINSSFGPPGEEDRAWEGALRRGECVGGADGAAATRPDPPRTGGRRSSRSENPCVSPDPLRCLWALRSWFGQLMRRKARSARRLSTFEKSHTGGIGRSAKFPPRVPTAQRPRLAICPSNARQETG